MLDLAKTLLQTVLQPLVIFGLLYLGFWLVHRHASSIGETLVALGVRRLEFQGFVVEIIHELVSVSESRLSDHVSDDEQQKLRQLTERLTPLVRGGRILWVDDQPSDNQRERVAFTRLGIGIQICRTNKEALRELDDKRERYDLVISDWRRGELDPEREPEGLALLREIRHSSLSIPVIFYTITQSLNERRKQVAEAGGQGLTQSPIELYRWTLAWLASRSREGPS